MKQMLSSVPDPVLVQRAAEWMARLWSDNASDAERAACAAWRAQKPEHEAAWQCLQAVNERFDAMPGAAAHAALKSMPTPSPARRKVLQLLGLGVVAGGAWRLAGSSETWALASADYTSATGEIRRLVLPDGSNVVLNTGSAIDVAFSVTQRRIVLRAGEILVATAKDGAARPFSVRSRHGTVRALGTEFVVRQYAHQSSVSVQHGAVEIRCEHGSVQRLEAEQQASFDAGRIGAVQQAEENAAAWSRGVLVAEQMRLQDLLDELGRYRRGMVRCDPAVAGLRVSGVFSLRDTDRALRNLALALPLEIRYLSPYWVRVLPRRQA
ncbi:FecR domain-containing protein [Pseudoduganella violacea]|uniref:Transmembrane sensor n=1 Tax=Pseudoduganella violacea TaxID=1715466 RepID=A0A7W5B6L8_9BURK|nr:FecR domain-containing protein [Pseudoduganella violacea]MBB3117115.1 transmembrane sensor [Pseudoduganella violacea]